MRLYVGGAWQGQEELARRENPGALVVGAFHERIREVVARGGDARAYAERLWAEHPEAVVVADEVGMGVVPLEAKDRAWREAVGRAVCLLAQRAERVTRVTCGLAVRLK